MPQIIKQIETRLTLALNASDSDFNIEWDITATGLIRQAKCENEPVDCVVENIEIVDIHRETMRFGSDWRINGCDSYYAVHHRPGVLDWLNSRDVWRGEIEAALLDEFDPIEVEK